MEMQSGIEDTLALTGYDSIKAKKIPSLEEVGINAISGFSYEFIGKKIVGAICERMATKYNNECLLLGRFAGIAAGLALGQWMMNKPMPAGQNIIKSIISIGALSLIKGM